LFTGCRQPEPKLGVVVEIHAHRAGPLSDGIVVHAEQTLPAFVRTWCEQCVVCELDVRFTADGVAVVFHDRDLRRMTGAPGQLHELDAAAFGALRTDILGAGRRLAPGAAPVPLATLEAVLRLARRHRAGLNVELKNLPGEPGFDATEATAERLAALLRGSRIDPARLTVQTFWAPDLAVLGRVLPAVRRSLLVEPGAEAHGVERALLAGADAVGLRWPASPDTVRRAHEHGLRVMAYTLNEPAAVRDAWRAGVDVIITDDPAMAQRILARLPSLAVTMWGRREAAVSGVRTRVRQPDGAGGCGRYEAGEEG
jgi:glycerophosphoryl diester phosphodiesterase